MLGISVVYCELWDAWRNCKKHCIDVWKGFECQDTVEGGGRGDCCVCVNLHPHFCVQDRTVVISGM